MNVKLTRLNDAFHFEAVDTENRSIQIDANPQIGGEGKGTRPMELLLISIGGCASIDLGLILKKQKQKLESYAVEVSAERHDNTAKSLKKVDIHFQLKGELDLVLVNKAIQLTLQKYCSVILSLHPLISVTYQTTIKNA